VVSSFPIPTLMAGQRRKKPAIKPCSRNAARVLETDTNTPCFCRIPSFDYRWYVPSPLHFPPPPQHHISRAPLALLPAACRLILTLRRCIALSTTPLFILRLQQQRRFQHTTSSLGRETYVFPLFLPVLHYSSYPAICFFLPPFFTLSCPSVAHSRCPPGDLEMSKSWQTGETMDE